MTLENTITQSSLMLSLSALYIALEAGLFIQHRYRHNTFPTASTMKSERHALNRWKRELAAYQGQGAEAVDSWVTGWLFSLGDQRIETKEIKRGNVEKYLSERILGPNSNGGRDDSTRHHVLIGLVSQLERARKKRFPSGTNVNLLIRSADESSTKTAYKPLSLSIVEYLFAALCSLFLSANGCRTLVSVTMSTSGPSDDLSLSTPEAENQTVEPPTKKSELVPHINTATRAIPASSLAMVSSLSNLSSIGMCAAPPLRTRQRSRTIDAVIACAQVPVSSLAMMSSLSNLSSIGMCAAPPLRTRQRSRGATLVVGYASAIPFALSKQVSSVA